MVEDLIKARRSYSPPSKYTKYFFPFFVALFILLASSLPALSQSHEIKSSEKGITLLEAVRNTLKNQPAIQIQQQQVDFNEGVLQEAGGQFDWNFNAGVSRTETTTPLTERQTAVQGSDASRLSTTKYSAGFDKQFRSGITIGPGLEVNHNNDHSSFTDPNSYSNVNFRIVLPLLKGKGVEATGAQEKAASIDLESARLDHKASVSRSILGTTQAYWNLCAARERLDIYKDAEAQARDMLGIYRKMVEADVKPLADLDQLRANLSDKVSQRTIGENDLIAAVQNLWMTMGIPYNHRDALYPLDLLPEAVVPDDEWRTLISIEYYIDLSRKNRPDFLSLKKKAESAAVLLKAAELKQRAKLDVVLSTGYAGLWESSETLQSLRSLDTNVRGPNASAGIEYRFPVENNSAKGFLRQRQAVYNQAVLQVADLDRLLISLMTAVVPQLRYFMLAWKESLIAVESYKNAVRNEDKKMRMGMSTVIDLIQTQDRLRNARLTVLSNRSLFAQAVAQVRFLTGTIISEEGDLENIDPEQLITLPKVTVSSQETGG
jgi:outer membrane protein